MSKEFTMGARLTLTDDFTNPMRDIWRATEQFRQATTEADDSAGRMVRELNDLNREQREVSQTTRTAAQAIDNATQASNNLADESQAAHREAQQLARNMQDMGRTLDPAAREMQNLTSEMNQATNSMGHYYDAAGRLRDANGRFISSTRQASNAASTFRDAAGRMVDANGRVVSSSRLASSHLDMYNRAAGTLRGSISGLTGVIAGLGAGMAAVAGYNWLIDSNAQMEQYQNTLATVMKSQEKATETLAWANKFAAKTPFEIPQIVEATTIMTTYGMNAQKQLGLVGDMASVMGKDLMQAVEAVADAQTGELERLKEFGITKKMLEEQAAIMGLNPFDSKGSLKDQEALNKTLFAIMEERYKGGMEIQSKSFNGMLSNLSDFIAGFGRQLGKPLFDVFKVQLAGLLTMLNGLQDSGAVDAFIKNIVNFTKNTAAVFKTLYNIVGPIFGVLFGSAANVLGPVIDLIAASAPVFKALGTAAQFLSDAIVKGWPIIGPIVEGVAAAWLAYGAVLLGIRLKTMAVTAALAIQKGALFAYRAAVLATNIVMMALRGQFVALWFTMLASPVGMLVTALGLLIGVGILLYRNWDKVKAAFTATFGFMAPYLETAKQAFINFANTAKASVGPALEWIGQKIAAAKTWGQGIMASLGPVGEAIRNSFTTIGNTIATLSPLIARLGLSFLGVSGPIGWVIAAVVSLGAFLFKLVNNNDSVKASLLAGWESIKAGIQPLLQAFAQIGQVFLTALTPAIAEFSTAFATLGPEFAKTGQVLADSFVTMGPAFAELGAALGELGTAFSQIFAQLIPAILPLAMQIFQTVVPMAIQLFGQLASTWVQIATAVLPLILQAVSQIIPMVLTIIQTVIPIVIQIILQIVPVILQIAQQIIPLILQAVQLVFPVIMTIIQTVVPIVIQLLNLIIPVILQIAQTVIPLILQAVQLVFPAIVAIINAVIPIITTLLTFAAQIITGVLIPAIQIILKVVQIVFPLIMTVISNALAIITGIIKTATALLQGNWSGAWSAIKETAVTIMNNILSFFESIDLLQTGKDIISGLIKGIGSMAKAAADKVREVAGGIKKAVTNFFDINSPSKVFYWVGDMLGLGLTNAMDDSQASLAKSAEGMAAAAMPNLGAVAGPDLSTHLEVATNMQIPTVPGLSTTLDVGTQFDGKQPPSYAAAAAGEVNPAGASRSEKNSGRNVIIQKLIEKLEIVADKDVDVDKLVDELIAKLQEKLDDADEILGNGDMGVLF